MRRRIASSRVGAGRHNERVELATTSGLRLTGLSASE
jgi:hypothetical protein